MCVGLLYLARYRSIGWTAGTPRTCFVAAAACVEDKDKMVTFLCVETFELSLTPSGLFVFYQLHCMAIHSLGLQSIVHKGFGPICAISDI